MQCPEHIVAHIPHTLGKDKKSLIFVQLIIDFQELPGWENAGTNVDQVWKVDNSFFSFIAHMFIVYKGDRRQKHVQQNLTLPWTGAMLSEVTQLSA